MVLKSTAQLMWNFTFSRSLGESDNKMKLGQGKSCDSSNTAASSSSHSSGMKTHTSTAKQSYNAQHAFTPNASVEFMDMPNTTCNDYFASEGNMTSSLISHLKCKANVETDITPTIRNDYKSVSIRPMVSSPIFSEEVEEFYIQSLPSSTPCTIAVTPTTSSVITTNKAASAPRNTTVSTTTNTTINNSTYHHQDSVYRSRKQPVRQRVLKKLSNKVNLGNHNTRQSSEGKEYDDVRKFLADIKFTPMVMVENIRPTPREAILIDSASTGQLLPMLSALKDSKGANVRSSLPQPLYLAMQQPKLSVVIALLRHGANPNSSWQDKTCVYMAYQSGRLDMLEVLLQGGASLEVTPDIMSGRTRGTPELSLLFMAVESGNLPAVKLLLRYAPTVNICSFGRSIVHAACNTNNVELIQALYLAAEEKCEVLDFDAMHNQETVTMLAARNGQTNLLGFLLHVAKTNVNQRDESGFTALHHAAAYSDDVVNVHLLLDAGANTTFMDKRGRSAHDMALIYQHTNVADAIDAVFSNFSSSLMLMARNVVKKHHLKAMLHKEAKEYVPVEILDFVILPLHKQLSTGSV